MDPEFLRQIAAIHQSDRSCVIATTGGGATATAWLMAVPGASRTILEAISPYSEAALCRFLGKRPDGFCTAQTSADMADAAWSRALTLHGAGACTGVGCTASLATDRPKRGEHRFFVSVAVEDLIHTAELILAKGARSRADEEEIVSRTIIDLLAQAVGVGPRALISLRPGEQIERSTKLRDELLAKFVRHEKARVRASPDGRVCDETPEPMALLAGSFNPLHDAHCALLHLAETQLRLPGAFELSATNVDKPPLSLAEIRRRTAQFHGRASVWLTHAPTFVEKSALFPGSIFVIGADTAARLVLPRYYEHGEAGMANAAEQMRSRNCRFLVAARADSADRLLGLEDLALPACFHGLLEGIPKAIFCNAISSTALRKHAGMGAAAS